VHGVYKIHGPSAGCSCHFLLIDVWQSLFARNDGGLPLWSV